MKTDTELQQLLRMAGMMTPGMRQAENFVENTVKLRGLGPDDPIEWGAFSTEGEQPVPQQSAVLQLLGMIAPPARAETGKRPRGDDLLTRLLMLGYDHEGITK